MNDFKRITLMCPINTLGYGVASFNILKALSKKAHVGLSLIGDGVQVNTDQDMKLVMQSIHNNRQFDYDAPCIKIFHQDRMDTFCGKGLRIGFPFFELDEFSPIEKHHLNSLDKIFVASSWAKKICIENKLTVKEEDIHVVPLGVDSELFTLPMVETKSENTIFFNCGKWEVRKGHDVLVEMFNKSFEVTDNVELWMMCDSPFMKKEENEEWRNLYLNSKLGSKIKFIDRVASHSSVYSIMSQVDCGVFPARAEGWNLELLEIMSCGKHVIATDYSGHTEFCNPNNTMLIDFEQKENAYDGIWFNGNYGNWMKLTENNKDQCVHYMRDVHKKKQEGKLTVNDHGIITATTFSWENAASAIMNYV